MSKYDALMETRTVSCGGWTTELEVWKGADEGNIADQIIEMPDFPCLTGWWSRAELDGIFGNDLQWRVEDENGSTCRFHVSVGVGTQEWLWPKRKS